MSVSRSTRILGPDDRDVLMALRKKALINAPEAFGSSPGDDRMEDPVLVHELLTRSHDLSVSLGAFVGDELTGMVGLMRSQRKKTTHLADLYGMYVSAEHRGLGLGRLVMEASIAHVRSWRGVRQIRLSVAETAVAADTLYRSLGFQHWGTEPEALYVDGRYVTLNHLYLQL